MMGMMAMMKGCGKGGCGDKGGCGGAAAAGAGRPGDASAAAPAASFLPAVRLRCRVFQLGGRVVRGQKGMVLHQQADGMCGRVV